MDVETRLSHIRSIAVEIIEEKELRELLTTREKLWAYDGFEPSGLATLVVGIYRPLLIRDLQRAGIRFKVLLADSFAWINNKLGGDLEKIRYAASYFIEVWKVAFERFGVDSSKVEYVWHKDLFDDPDYWRKVLLIAKHHSISRTARALTIAGRLSAESNPTALYFYPSMQAADIFHLKVDIAQLGLDQRKVNILAREIAQKNVGCVKLAKLLGYEEHGYNGVPVLVHHRMLPSMAEPPTTLPGFDENPKLDFMIAYKASKSMPSTTIYIHDDFETLRKKLEKAYCPPKSKTPLLISRSSTGEEFHIEIENPLLVYIKEIVFRADGRFILRTKSGKEEVYYSYSDVVQDYDKGLIHPLDLKMSLAYHLESYIKPLREYFEKGPGREVYQFVKSVEITR